MFLLIVDGEDGTIIHFNRRGIAEIVAGRVSSNNDFSLVVPGAPPVSTQACPLPVWDAPVSVRAQQSLVAQYQQVRRQPPDLRNARGGPRVAPVFALHLPKVVIGTDVEANHGDDSAVRQFGLVQFAEWPLCGRRFLMPDQLPRPAVVNRLGGPEDGFVVQCAPTHVEQAPIA